MLVLWKEFSNLTSVSIFSFFTILQDSMRMKSKSQKRCTVIKFGRWCGEIWCDFNMFSSTAFACVEKLWPSIQSKQYTCSPKKKESRHLKIKNLSNFFAKQAKSVFRLHKLQTVFKLMFWFLELVHHDIIFPFQSLHPQTLLDLQGSCFWK